MYADIRELLKKLLNDSWCRYIASPKNKKKKVVDETKYKTGNQGNCLIQIVIGAVIYMKKKKKIFLYKKSSEVT